MHIPLDCAHEKKEEFFVKNYTSKENLNKNFVLKIK